MNERVKAYRERQKAAGLSQVSLWLDAPTVKLLKQAAEEQHRQPGEIVSLALHAWWTTLAPTETPPSTPMPTAPPAPPDPAQLRAMVREVVQEVLAESRPTGPSGSPDPHPLPRPSLYQWPISL